MVVSVLVALWAVWPQILTVFGNVLGIADVLVVFLWCFGGVPVVFWWQWSKKLPFLNQNGSPINTKLASTDIKTLLLGLYTGLMIESRLSLHALHSSNSTLYISHSIYYPLHFTIYTLHCSLHNLNTLIAFNNAHLSSRAQKWHVLLSRLEASRRQQAANKVPPLDPPKKNFFAPHSGKPTKDPH